MKKKMNFQLISMLAIALAVISTACTKSKELTNKVDTKAYFAKSNVLGDNATIQTVQTKENPRLLVQDGAKIWHMSRGIEEADSNNDVGATPGMSNDFGLVHARITETELQFLSSFDTMGRKGTETIVASYKITAQFDIKRDKNDFGNETNKVIEDTTAPWQNREFIRVDWASPTNSLANFAKGLDMERQERNDADADLDTLLSTGMTEENTNLLENPVFDSSHISFLVETAVKVANERSTHIFPEADVAAKSYRVVYRTHLLELKDTDFQPVPYTLKDFSRFGFFFTQQNFTSPRGILESNQKIFANTHNICEAGRAGSCSTNQIRWVLSKDFPEQYKAVARRVVGEWNQTFQQALNRTDNVVYLDETAQATISDPTANVLAYYPDRTKSGLLGVAQWVSDPRNGLLVGVRATIYGDGIQYEVESVNQLIDILASTSDGAALGVPDTGLPEVYDSAFQKEATAEGVVLNNNAAAIAMGLKNKSRPTAVNAAVNSKLALDRAIQGAAISPEKQSIRMALLAQKAPQFYALTNLQTMIDSLTPQMKRDLPREAFGVQIPNLGGLEAIAFAEETLKNQKRAEMRDAANGVHGTDLVEDAAIRFLMRKLKDEHLTPADLVAHKAEIDEEIAQETFYTTALHEMGHTFGLRHNFAGSADARHYSPEYYDILKNVNAGNAPKEDLDPYASSSIMDYGRDFYAQQGGIGPYDKAAIKYAYNRSINKESDPVTLAHYTFCTDHQVGEELLCRRFDKGSNLSQQIQAYVDYYDHNYALMHYRRGRIAEGNWAGWGSPSGLMSSLLRNVFLPVRQVMDEEIYAIRASPDSGTKTDTLCDKAIVAQSINAGEMANICSPLAKEQAGIDATDEWGTLGNALMNRQTGKMYKDPSAYMPNGFADILYANELAKKFFREVLGSAEPGDYVAVKNSAGQYVLHALPEQGSNLDEKLIALATDDLHVKADDVFMKTAKANMIRLSVSGKGRTLEDRESDTAGFWINDSLGSFWDKYAALRALVTRNYGVEKYNAHSMSLNAYVDPQTTAWTSGLFGAIIGEANGFSTIQMPVTSTDGKQAMTSVFVPASLDSNTLAVGSMLAVGGLASDNDRSMLTKLKICNVNEGDCGQSIEGETVEYHAAESNDVYRAFQTVDGDSIAFDILSDAKQYEDARAQAVALLNSAAGTQQLDLKAIQDLAPSIISDVVSGLAKVTDFQKTEKNPLKTGSGNANLPDQVTHAEVMGDKLMIAAQSALTNVPKMGEYTAIAYRDKVLGLVSSVNDEINASLAKMGDDGKCYAAANGPAAVVPPVVVAPVLNSANHATNGQSDAPAAAAAPAPTVNPAVTAAMHPGPIAKETLPANPTPACSAQDKGTIRLSLLEVQASVKQFNDLLKAGTDSTIAIRHGSTEISLWTSALQRKDTKIENLRNLIWQASHL